MTEPRTDTAKQTLAGTVVGVDYDADTITVELDSGEQRTFSFEMFDSQDVYQPGQSFQLTLDDAGAPDQIATKEQPDTGHTTVNGYVESVDSDDELAWVYIRGEEGWQRKVMPLSLFSEAGLDRAGVHFLLDQDEHGTPLALRQDTDELEMLPLEAEDTKPRWTDRPAAEAEPESEPES